MGFSRAEGAGATAGVSAVGASAFARTVLALAEDPLVDCPSCGEPSLKRTLSAPRFRLKGQGWYETDFKKDNQRNLHGDKEPSKKDDKKSDSKKSSDGGDSKKPTSSKKTSTA